jgi:SAM-dependent methyltransferase
MRKILSCPICFKQALQLTDALVGYQEPNTFSIHFCPNCELNFPNPQFVNSNIYEIIYSQGRSHPDYDRYWKYHEEIINVENPLKYLAEKEINFFAIQDFIKNFKILKNVKILEIGSGLGYLTFALRKAGFNAFGVDVSSKAVKAAINRFGDFYEVRDLVEIAKHESNQYDLVISTETIEHVDNLLEFISALLSLVKKNGFAVLTTPNRSFFPNDCLWESSLPPIHLWWLSEKTMVYLANQLNCEIEFINMSKWHSKNPLIIDFRKYIDKNLFNSVLTSNGDINKEHQKGFTNPSEITNFSSLFKKLLIFCFKSVFLKSIIMVLVNLIYPGRFGAAGKRSTQMAVILKKV